MKTKLTEMICPECNVELEPYIDDEMSCSCHISAPCAKCCDDRMICPECGDIFAPDDFEPTPLEKAAMEIVKNNPIPRALLDYEIREKIQNGEFEDYTLRLNNESSFVIYDVYFSEKTFKKKPTNLEEWIGGYVGRPNGFTKYDMVKIDSNERDGIVKVHVSYCID